MRRARPTPSPVLAQNQEEVAAFCAACRAEGRFAFDTEFVMEDRYESEVCLVQVANASTVLLIDPFLELDLEPIWEMVRDVRVETVVHAGQEDLALCVQHTGGVPRHVFDAQIAAGLVSHDYPLSLQRLVQAHLHVRLRKARTLTDWRRRPLRDAEIRYAADDVAYLLPIHDKLVRKLKQMGRMAWARADLERFEEITLYRRVEAEKLRRLKGSASLKGQELAVLQALLAWREPLAQKLNRPARAVLKDHLLVEIARTRMAGFDEVRALRGLNLAAPHVRDLCTVVREASTLPPSQWPSPEPRDNESPFETVLITLVTALIRGYCLENQLAYGLVATKSSIRDLVRCCAVGATGERCDVHLLTGWRGETVGALVEEVLSGRRTMRVERENGKLALRVAPPIE